LWTISVALITLWLLGLITGYVMDSLLHILYTAAIVLLVASIRQEVSINRKLRHLSRSRD
jgi:hypothetical protein